MFIVLKRLIITFGMSLDNNNEGGQLKIIFLSTDY